MAGRNLTLELFGTPQEVGALIRQEATRQGVDPHLAFAVAMQESNLSNYAGDKGEAQGYFQLHKGAAIDSGVDPALRFDPQENIRGGVAYLKRALRLAEGDVPTALSRYYNGGGDKNYVANVMRFYPQSAPKTPQKPGLLARMGNALVGSAEAATAGRNLTDELFAVEPATVTPDLTAPATAPAASVPPPVQEPTEPLPPPSPDIARIQVDIPYGESATVPAPSAPGTPQLQDAHVRSAAEAITRQYGYDPALIGQAAQYDPSALIQEAQPFGPPAQGTLKNLAQRAGVGVAKAATSFEQALKTGLGLVGLQTPADVALVDLRAKMLEKYSRAVQEESPYGLGFAAEAAGSLAFPSPKVPGIGNAPRVLQAVAEGAKTGMALMPATSTSPNPDERLSSYAREKGLQGAYGGATGGILDAGAQVLGSTARWLLGKSRGVQELNRVNDLNVAEQQRYLGELGDVAERNQAAKDAYRTEAKTVLEENTQRLSRHQVEVAEANARNRAAQEAYEAKVQASQLAEQRTAADLQAEQKAYQSRIAAHEEAIAGARAVPGRYGPENIPSVREALEGPYRTRQALMDDARALDDPALRQAILQRYRAQTVDEAMEAIMKMARKAPEESGLTPTPIVATNPYKNAPLLGVPPHELELQDFVRQHGGIARGGEELSGELRGLLSRRETGTSKLQNNVSGLSLQHMAEAAEQHGFIPTADTEALVDALRTSIDRGTPVYSLKRTWGVDGPTYARQAAPLPEPVNGSVTDILYARLRNVAGQAPVITKPAQEAAENVSLGLAQHATPGSGGPLEKIATTIRELGPRATVEDIVPLLQDAGKLMRSQDGNVRTAARNLFVGLHDAMDQSAAQLPETAMARTLLQQATMAARRGFAVDDLSGVVRSAIRYNKDGTAQTLNIGSILTALERRFEGANPRDKLFARSFTPEERASILDDFRKFRALPELGKRPVALSNIPAQSAPALQPPLPGPLPIKPVLQALPPLPQLEGPPALPEMATAHVEGLGGMRLLKDVAAGGLPVGLYTHGDVGTTFAAATAVAAGDFLAYGLARAIINPRLRPLIFRSLDASGHLSPAVYGLLGAHYGDDRQSLGETR